MTGDPLNRRTFLSSTLAAAGAASLLGSQTRAAEPVARSGKPYMKLSLAGYSFNRYMARHGTAEQIAKASMTLEKFIDYCAELDLDGCELTGYYFPRFVVEAPTSMKPKPVDRPGVGQSDIHEPRDKAFAYINSLKQRAFRQGLDVSGTAIGNDFCVPDEKKYQAQIEDCRRWIDRAAVLGAPVIRIFAGKVHQGDTEEQAFARCVKGIDAALEHAARKGVFLALENHGGITATAEKLLRIVKAVKPSPWFGVNLDGGNFREGDPYKQLAAIAPYTINAQIKAALHIDGRKTPADLDRIIGILRDAGYRGYVVLEYEEREDPKKAIPRYIDKLRKLIG